MEQVGDDHFQHHERLLVVRGFRFNRAIADNTPGRLPHVALRRTVKRLRRVRKQ
jgi:hypothetical protein